MTSEELDEEIWTYQCNKFHVIMYDENIFPANHDVLLIDKIISDISISEKLQTCELSPNSVI